MARISLLAAAVAAAFTLSATSAAVANWRPMDATWWTNQGLKPPANINGACWTRSPTHQASNYRHNGETFLICKGKNLPAVSDGRRTPIRTGAERPTHIQVGPLKCSKVDDSCS